jgi:hypothetical protein
MPNLRWRSSLRLFLVGVLCAVPLACMQVVTSKSQLVVASANTMCPVGSEGCACTDGGGCDPGLYCDNGICVSDYGDEEYLYEADLAPMPASEPSPPMTLQTDVPSFRVTKESGRERRARRRAKRKFGKDVAGAAAPAAPESSTTMSEPAAVAGVTTAEAPRDPAAEVDNARQVIYTAVLQVAVYDLDAAAELAEDLPRRYGGWIESRYDYQITLRITAAHLFEAIEELSALGVVLDESLLAEDVTAEYVDLESRIRVLEQLVAQLEAMLALAKTVEEALKIRVELDRVRLELESARARMRQLAELIDFSTLTVILSLRGPADPLPSSNDPFPWVDDLGVEITEYR